MQVTLLDKSILQKCIQSPYRVDYLLGSSSKLSTHAWTSRFSKRGWKNTWSFYPRRYFSTCASWRQVCFHLLWEPYLNANSVVSAGRYMGKLSLLVLTQGSHDCSRDLGERKMGGLGEKCEVVSKLRGSEICRIHDFPIDPTPDMLSFYTVFISHHIKPSFVDSYLSGICEVRIGNS